MTFKAEDDGDVLNMVFESTNGERYVAVGVLFLMDFS